MQICNVVDRLEPFTNPNFGDFVALNELESLRNAALEASRAFAENRFRNQSLFQENLLYQYREKYWTLMT